MKKSEKTITCTNVPHPKTYIVDDEVVIAKRGKAICPACGEYHKVEKEN